MILSELLKLLNKIKKIHPEAKDAAVIAVNRNGEISHVTFIGYDKKHKPHRIELEE